MAIQFNREAYDKVFTDLENFYDFCRFEGFCKWNEKNLYNNASPEWQAYVNKDKKIKSGYKGKNFDPNFKRKSPRQGNRSN